MDDRESAKVFKILSDKRCLDILKIISVEPSFVGELASNLKTKESRISEKMRIMREAGIVSEEWKRIGNKLVKFYKPLMNKISVSLVDGSIKTETGGNEVKEILNIADVDAKVPKTDKLVGRKAELHFIEKYPHVLVTGIPGIGKTTLVANFVRSTNREAFWHDIRETDTLKYVIIKFASYLNKHGDDSLLKSLKQERDRRTHINLIISGMRKLNSTVILDDLHKCLDDDIVEFVMDLTRSIPEISVILITRTPLEFYDPSVRVLNLQELRAEDALTLIKNTSRGRKIVEEVGGHPLIVKLAGNIQPATMGSTKILSPQDYFERQILPTLPKELVGVLEKISFFEGATELEELEFIFGEISKARLRTAIETGLIRMHRSSIRMNDLIKEVLQANAPSKSDTHNKIALYYASKKKPEYLITGLHHLKLGSNNEEISGFLSQFGMELINSPYLNNFQEELIQIERQLESCETKSEVLYWIGRILSIKRRYSESLKYFERARMCPQSSSLEPYLLYDEATAIQNVGEFEQSEELFWSALKKVEGSNSIQEGRILYGLANVLTTLGRQEEARALLERAIKIFKEKRDLVRYNVTLFGMAYLEFIIGNIKEALRLNKSAIQGFLSLDAINSYTSSLISKGDFLFHAGQKRKGISSLGKAIEILGTLDYADLDLALALLKRSIMLGSLGLTKESESDIRRAKKIISVKGDKFLNGFLSLAEGALMLARDELTEAEVSLKKAMKCEKLDPVAMYRARREWALLLIKKGRIKDGMKILNDLIEYFRKRNYVTFLEETKSMFKEIAK
ncbi:MAG: tetratricopeptide repeat protein [Thermoplasmatales archaeon]|nr:tetratricopeptide repeat protein [Thermoplasmatales archaeon]